MSFLRFLESIRLPFFDWLFSLITHIGEETVFLAVALFIFWCVSKKNGYYVLCVGFIGTVLNQFLKMVFRIPRPWVKDPDFTIVESARAEATGYSFPSGHTQNAVGTFGTIAVATKRKWLRIISIVICVLVPFSRMYLGVHTPLDVCVSFVIAAALIFAIRPIIEKGDKDPKFMYAVFICMSALALALVLFIEFYNFPAETDAANLASAEKNAYSRLGAVRGIVIAFPIEKRFINFETEGKWYVQLIKLVLGLALTVGLKAVLKAPLNMLFAYHAVSNAVRYAIVVIFAVAVWPLSFPLINKIGKKS